MCHGKDFSIFGIKVRPENLDWSGTVTVFKLTGPPICFFETFGYLSFPNLIVNWITAIEDALEKLWAENGNDYHGRIAPVLQDLALPSLLWAAVKNWLRYWTICEFWALSPVCWATTSITYIRNYSNYYVGDTDWYKERLHIKIAST